MSEFPPRIGRYELVEQVGSGGFATVYRAMDTLLEREVALKLMRPLLLSDVSFVKRFQREAKTAAAFDHPNIVPILDYGESDNRLFLVMKFVDAGSLEDLLAEGPLAWERTVQIVEAVAAALDFAHGNGVVHRDVKPGNVLLGQDGRVMLGDFGVVKALESGTITTTLSGGVLGTPAYVAPEIWNGEKATSGSDVYSLACLAFEMVTGKKLFDAPTPPATMTLHFRPPQFPDRWPEGTPPGLEQVLGKALAREPGERYESAGDFVGALMALAEDPLAEPYAELQSAVSGERWEEAVSLAERILDQDPHYRDVPALLAQVTEQEAERERQSWVARWRDEAEGALEAGNPEAALAAAQQWQRMAPDDPQAEAALERARSLAQSAEVEAEAEPVATTEADAAPDEAGPEPVTSEEVRRAPEPEEAREEAPVEAAPPAMPQPSDEALPAAELESESVAAASRVSRRFSALRRSLGRLPRWSYALAGVGVVAIVLVLVFGGGLLRDTMDDVAEEAAQTSSEQEMTSPEEEAADEGPMEQEPAGEEAMPEGDGSGVGFAVMPGGFLERALGREFAGSVVTLFFNDAELGRFRASMEPFENTTGIEIEYEGSQDYDIVLETRVATGDTPDIADLGNPRLLARLVQQGAVVDPTSFINGEWLHQQYDVSWLDMALMKGLDGEQMAGVWHRFYPKSLVWYPGHDFEVAGYPIPGTWQELLALSDQIVADGGTPWCIGMEDGEATGWVATDWTEDAMLRTTSLENYDAWVAGELPFDSPEVREAIQAWSEIWFNDDYVLGGREAIMHTYFGDSPAPMFDDPPSCWLHRQGNIITSFFPENAAPIEDYASFYLPMIEEEYGRPWLVTGDIMAMFNDRPEVRALMEYFTTPQSAGGWLTEGGALAAHESATPDMYGQPIERDIAELVQDADAFRFDASDLMPPEVGDGAFWTGMLDYVSGAADLNQVKQGIDAAWPME